MMRIVSHSCSNTELLCALGLAEHIVGVDDHSDYPPDVVKRVEKVGPDLDVSIEKIQALKPDLVVMSDTLPGHAERIEQLRESGLPVQVLAPRCLDDIAHDYRRLGEWTGQHQRAEQLAVQFERDLDGLTVVAPKEPPRVLVEWWPKPVIAPCAQSWVTALLERAGGINPWAQEDVESRPLETPEVIERAPEAIVMSWCGVSVDKYHAHVVTRRPDWHRVPAVANGQVFGVSEAFLGRPGPRLIHGLAALRQVVRSVLAGR
jgi:iron complex transport system substrate-binding protein